jgi:hypothetical protein
MASHASSWGQSPRRGRNGHGAAVPDGRRSLVLVSDNNFAASQFTQFLLFALD